MAKAVRDLARLDGLGLKATWFETLEPVPAGAPARSRQYFGDIDVYDFDPSFDLWGGGGIVSTTRDLAHFYRAILVGQVFERPQTLALGLATPHVAHEDADTPHAPLLAVMKIGQHQCWGHTGFFGTLAAYCPDIDTAIAVNVNANVPGKNTAIYDIASAVAAVLDENGAR